MSVFSVWRQNVKATVSRKYILLFLTHVRIIPGYISSHIYLNMVNKNAGSSRKNIFVVYIYIYNIFYSVDITTVIYS